MHAETTKATKGGGCLKMPLQPISNRDHNLPIIRSSGNEVLRAGPVVSFNFVPQDTTNVDPSKPAPAPKWLFNVTYSWYQDFLSSHTFQHVNPSLSYNFTDNIGLTLGYEWGQIEATGKKVDLTTISLTVRN